jgi:predicted cupin superfamily sugar epimerase
MKTVRSFVDGPRWAKLESLIKNHAWAARLDIKTDVEKGWFRETVRFEVSGEDKVVDQYLQDIYNSIDKWNEN